MELKAFLLRMWKNARSSWCGTNLDVQGVSRLPAAIVARVQTRSEDTVWSWGIAWVMHHGECMKRQHVTRKTYLKRTSTQEHGCSHAVILSSTTYHLSSTNLALVCNFRWSGCGPARKLRLKITFIYDMKTPINTKTCTLAFRHPITCVSMLDACIACVHLCMWRIVWACVCACVCVLNNYVLCMSKRRSKQLLVVVCWTSTSPTGVCTCTKDPYRQWCGNANIHLSVEITKHMGVSGNDSIPIILGC